jgi:hypothetical protein
MLQPVKNGNPVGRVVRVVLANAPVPVVGFISKHASDPAKAKALLPYLASQRRRRSGKTQDTSLIVEGSGAVPPFP